MSTSLSRALALGMAGGGIDRVMAEPRTRRAGAATKNCHNDSLRRNSGTIQEQLCFERKGSAVPREIDWDP